MTPEARVAAAIEVLDGILAGQTAEAALAAWARRSRFAGSGDRAALRDLVFDALRRRRSYGAVGGADTGRGLMIGALRHAGLDPAGVFSGQGYAPAVLRPAEQAVRDPVPGSGEAVDCPDWLMPHFRASLGADAVPELLRLRARARPHLRVNLRKTDRDAVLSQLADEGIEARAHPLSPTAVEVLSDGRALRKSPLLGDGRVELQDAASQAASDMVPLRAGQRVLDYCAGGGGKTLALAARVEGTFLAHDSAPDRMRDIPLRAERAGIRVRCLQDPDSAGPDPFDVVLVDAPCSGSGAWRRDPQGKWRLTPAMLENLRATQAGILQQAARWVASGGHLVYMTCSLLDAENHDQVDRFLSECPGWRRVQSRQFRLSDGGDGFFCCVLQKTGR